MKGRGAAIPESMSLETGSILRGLAQSAFASDMGPGGMIGLKG